MNFQPDDDPEEFPQDELICIRCNGSGEGQYDGSACSGCGGSGIERMRDEDDPD